jgi:hypothetical protein
MNVSLEFRFWIEDKPHLAEMNYIDWFRTSGKHGFPAGGGLLRTDRYVRGIGRNEIGLKYREHAKDNRGLELKGLVASRWGQLKVPPFRGDTELWCKWINLNLELKRIPLLHIQKVRWLRKFDTASDMAKEIRLNEIENPIDPGVSVPIEGCNIEVTQVTTPVGTKWWTFGLEAFGTLDKLQRNLEMAAQALYNRHSPRVTPSLFGSYPLWINAHCQ